MAPTPATKVKPSASLRDALDSVKQPLIEAGVIKRPEEVEWFTVEDLVPIVDLVAKPQKARKLLRETVVKRTGHAEEYLEWTEVGFTHHEELSHQSNPYQRDKAKQLPDVYGEIFGAKTATSYSDQAHVLCVALVYWALQYPEENTVFVSVDQLSQVQRAVGAKQGAAPFKDTGSHLSHGPGFFGNDRVTFTKGGVQWLVLDSRPLVALHHTLDQKITDAIAAEAEGDEAVPAPDEDVGREEVPGSETGVEALGAVLADDGGDLLGLLLALDDEDIAREVAQCADDLTREGRCHKKHAVINVIGHDGEQLLDFVQRSSAYLSGAPDLDVIRQLLPRCRGICIRVLLTHLSVSDLEAIEAIVNPYLEKLEEARKAAEHGGRWHDFRVVISLRNYRGDAPEVRGTAVVAAQGVRKDGGGRVCCTGTKDCVRLYLGPYDKTPGNVNPDVYVRFRRPLRTNLEELKVFEVCGEHFCRFFEERWSKSDDLKTLPPTSPAHASPATAST